MASLTAPVVSLDDEKFRALDYFLDRLNAGFQSKQSPAFQWGELEIDFLERCDSLLLQALRDCFAHVDLSELEDDEFRSDLLESIHDLDQEDASVDVLLQRCVDLFEQLEDRCESWLSLLFIDPQLIDSLHAAILEFEDRSPRLDRGLTALRQLLRQWVVSSPLFIEEDGVQFELKVEHLDYASLLQLIEHLLQAQLEYGAFLQSRFWSAHPEFLKRLRHVFEEAAEHMVEELLQ